MGSVDSEIQPSAESGLSDEEYESLSPVERRAVDRFLSVFNLRRDQVSLEVGSDVYREVARSNGQLDLFGGDKG